MKLGNLRLDNPFVQSPMSEITDAPFRTIARKFHNGLVFTEMVSAEALCRDSWRTMKMCRIDDDHQPCGLQLVGHNVERMAQAAVRAEKLGATIIDINSACPDKKVVKPGAGGALLKSPERLGAIIKAVVSAVDVPVSAKLRLGFASDESLKVSKVVEEAGASFLTLHGRTVAQKYSGKSDWSAIKRVAEELSIPVIANGDGRDEKTAVEMLHYTGAAGVMIGRATRGRPDLPGTAHDLLREGSFERMAPNELRATIVEHARLKCEQFGEDNGIKRMRRHVHWYLAAAGMRHDSVAAHILSSLKELEGYLDAAMV